MLVTLRLDSLEIAKDKNWVSFILVISNCTASILTLLIYIFPRTTLLFKITLWF